MKWIEFFIEDITVDHVEFCDKYIKRTLINTRNSFYRPAMRVKRLNIILFGWETVEEELAYEEPGFERAYKIDFDVNGLQITVKNPDLADALKGMPEKLRIVILRHYILGHKLKDIAKDLDVSAVMVGKYRDKALVFLKERMTSGNEEKKKDSSSGGYHTGSDQ